MTLPRFSLYGDPQVWVDNIREDPDGRWCNWKDVAPYVEHCQSQGITFEKEHVQPEMPRFDDDFLLDEMETDELDEDEIPDDDQDVVDFMEKHK